MRVGKNSVHLVQPSAHGAKTTQALYRLFALTISGSSLKRL